ncbi:MAG: exosortase/archaeosortase family protein [Chthonomonadaceae bacterium]|nr:exosortase/archaeosortase family protein [Chthonomonadaceae bacterium]
MNKIEPQPLASALNAEVLASDGTIPSQEAVNETPPDALDGLGFLDILRRVTSTDWLLLALIVALYVPTFRELMKEWDAPHAPQSYSLLIVPASLLLAYMMRLRGVGIVPKSDATGLAIVTLGASITCGGSLLGSMTFSAIGFVVTIAGVVRARFGREALRRFWFPVAYLLAVVPLPHELMNQMTFSLQQLSVKIAAVLLKPFGDVTVEGTRIHLPSYTLDVIAPCSGMTIILPLLVLTVFYLYMVVAPLWKKVGLFLFAVPTALIVNSVRVALIGVVGESFGGKAAETFHDWSGFITVGAGFAVLFYVAKEIKCNQVSDDIVL